MALILVVDHNSVAINVGDTVKLQGVVLAVNPASTHFKEVQIQVSYPVAGVPNPEIAGFAPAIHSGGSVHTPGADQIIEVAGSMLTH
jgi:hypothetical protein